MSRLEAEASSLRSWPRTAVSLETERLAGAASLVAREVESRSTPGASAAPDPAFAPLRAAALRLDVLAVRDAGGRVLSSSHWPERAGLAGQEGTSAREGGFAEVETATGTRPAWIVSRGFEPGHAGPGVVAGTFLDADLFGAVLRDLPRMVCSPDGTIGPAVGWPVGSLGPDDAATALRAADARITAGSWWAVLPDGGASAVAAAVALPPADPRGPERWLVVARPSSGGTAGGRWLVLGGLLAAGTLAAAAAGWWIGGLASRPFAEAVRAMSAVARDEADFGFSGFRPSEVEQVVSSYSRTRRALEEQRRRLRAAERAAAWKEAARRVAHDVKNPLAPIRLSMQNLLRARRRAPERFDQVLEESVQAVLDEVERLQRVVETFGEFARLPEPRIAPGDVDELVDSVLALHGAEPGIRWERNRGGGLSAVPMDRDLLARALRNVVTNAVQSMPETGGRIAVTTRREDDLVVVEVEDDGPGFQGESAARADQPYFTTREDGTGLGLAITARIVAEHGGYLRWENRPGGGARVILAIPGPAEPPPDGEDRT